MDKYVEATLAGSGSCVIVDGPFGIGKTHLLKAAGMAAVERGLTVVAGRTSVTDEPIPIHLLINFLRHVRSGETDFGELLSGDRNPFWLMDRVGELVADAARRHPLMVVLDDAQRIDDVSALALRGLVQSLASSPVMWLLARRPVATRSLAQHVVDWLIDHAAVQLHLDTPDREAVAALCTSFVGARPDSAVLAWADRCGGNPWLMENVFSALIKAGQMIVTDGTASVVGERLPEGVVAAVHRLLEQMSPPVRRLLVRGGRLGRSFTVDQAGAALADPSFDLPAAVDEAVQMGLLRRTGMELTFVHQVVGEALRHGGLRDWEPAEPATAADRSGVAAVVTAPAVPAAARPSGCGCAESAAVAIAALERGFDEPSRTLARALRLLAGAGRGDEAARLADLALSRGLAATAEAQLVHELVQGLRDTGGHALAAPLLRRALSRQDVCELDRAKLNRSLAETAARAGEALAPAPWRAEPVAGRDCAACERPLWTWLVRALVAADHRDEAAAVLAAVRPAAPAPLWHGHRAELLAVAGRLDEARGEAEAALRQADPSAPADTVPARLVLARIAMHGGDLATASDHLRMTERLVDEDATADRSRLDWALAAFHSASERPAMMVQTLINVDGQVVPDQLLFTEVPAAAAELIRQARQVGLGAEAEQAAELARRIARRNPTVQALGAGAEHAEGVLRNDGAALHRAAELYRLAGRPLAAAGALEDAARVEQGAREKARAVRLLESAQSLYAECGARRDADRVREKLGALDAPNVRRIGGERPKSGWESLTTAELRVVRAIVDGRTNREAASVLFLSPHTVDTHLRRVFSKLAINSRVELTKRFIAHEASPQLVAAAQRPGSAS